MTAPVESVSVPEELTDKNTYMLLSSSENLVSKGDTTIGYQNAEQNLSNQLQSSLAHLSAPQALEIFSQVFNLATNPLLHSQLPQTFGDNSSVSSSPTKGVAYQRKSKMEELYKWRVWTPYTIPVMKVKGDTAFDNHNMPPSKVVHCRAVADGCKETDLVQIMRPFGSIRALTLMPKLRQALVEYEELESAIACVTYAQIQPVLILGRQMYVNYSKSTEINRDFSNSNASVGQAPTNILLFTIINAIHPVNVETVKKICLQHAEVQRIVIFHKNGLQALVEFLSVDDAQRIQQALNGCDIFAGCCTLKIDFSKTGRLNVHANTTETYDIEIEKRKRGGSLLSLINNSETSPMFAQAAMASAFSQTSVGKSMQSLSEIFSNPKSFNVENGKLSADVIAALLASAASFPQMQHIITKLLNNENNPQISHTAPGINSLLSSGMDSSIDNESGSNISRTTLLNQQPCLTEPNSSQFSAIGSALSLVGGEGCVAMVYGVNHEKMNCDHLFNLFCLYGNVVKVKTLVNKPGSAMIQYTDKVSTDISIRNLNNLTLFGQKFQLSFSKHPFIADSSQVTPLFDGSPSAVSYADSRNNRFKFIPGGVDVFSRIHPPSKVLHYFNAPPDCTEDQLNKVFQMLGCEIPIKQATFSKSNMKSSSGLIEFTSVPAAVEALILANHFTMHRDNASDPFHTIEQNSAAFTLKLAFSPSNAINN
ncbi:heterogeneous nuclear ribonucleoprotein L isoform X1 [Hydra vulgaris]|nr:heterogeneous nuclear ribonucleoprotein L isoform X1 [Hydra vulgaris]